MSLHFENLQAQYVILAVLGMVIHILAKVYNRKDQSAKPSLVHFFSSRNNWLRIALTVLSTLALLLMSDDICSMFGLKMEDGDSAKSIFAFTAGYLNHSVIRNVLNMGKRKLGQKL
jgi:hypothetical protein